MSKSIPVHITTLESGYDLLISKSTSGQELFQLVVQSNGVCEVTFFGLEYTNKKGEKKWLKLQKKVTAQDIRKEETLNFKFLIKFYPENIEKEIRDTKTLRLLYLQVKSDINSGQIQCTSDVRALLSSLEEKEEMLEYLKVVENLKMYGVTYFEVKDKKGADMWLGVHATGVKIYEKKNKENPLHDFPYPEILNLTFVDKKFTIKFTDKKREDVVILSHSSSASKKILGFCRGNHELYMRRRVS